MGVKQSKRSVDITETSTKGEIEGFGNEGKVEKIIDGVLEKVAANGHVDGDLQNGIETLQNGVEPIQNGEAASVATDKISEMKSADELPVDVVNGQLENGEVNGEAEKSKEEKKTEEKKEKKKEKKEKIVKRFSFKNFSFTKKDKSKPMKEEKSIERMEETVKEEATTSPEIETPQPSQEQLIEPPKPAELSKPEVEVSVSNEGVTVQQEVVTEVEVKAPEKVAEVVSKIAEDLPPPLPASPPPSEPVEGKLITDRMDVSESISTFSSGGVLEVEGSFSNILAEGVESSKEAIKNAEQIAIETGKQIEEKATNLLKTVEERAEGSMKGVAEMLSQKTSELKDEIQNVLGDEIQTETKEVEEVLQEDIKLASETVTAVPVEISNVEALTAKAEDSTEKVKVAKVPVDIACVEQNAESKDMYDI